MHQCETCTEVPFCICLCHKPGVGDSLTVYSSVLQLIVAFQPSLLQGCLQLPFECVHKSHLNKGGGIRKDWQKGVF